MAFAQSESSSCVAARLEQAWLNDTGGTQIRKRLRQACLSMSILKNLYTAEIKIMGGCMVKKRIILLGILTILLIALAGCSNPKRDARDTNIQEQMENGTLDRN